MTNRPSAIADILATPAPAPPPERPPRMVRDRAVRGLATPPLYREVTCDNFTVHGSPENQRRQQAMLRLIQSWLSAWPRPREQLLVFAGPPGTGKGHMAWAMARQLAGQCGVAGSVIKMGDFIRDLRDTWRSRHGPSESQRLSHWRRLPFLVLDEVSRHAFLPRQIQGHLYDVLDYRIMELRPTILTTNETDQGLADLLGPALLDRLDAHGGLVDFGTESWRARMRQS